MDGHVFRSRTSRRLSTRPRGARPLRRDRREDAPQASPSQHQLDRAATSIVLNVAEGAGEFSFDEKCRFYRMARRSATEAGAILHIVLRRQHGPTDKIAAARELLELVKMTKPGFRGGA